MKVVGIMILAQSRHFAICIYPGNIPTGTRKISRSNLCGSKYRHHLIGTYRFQRPCRVGSAHPLYLHCASSLLRARACAPPHRSDVVVDARHDGVHANGHYVSISRAALRSASVVRAATVRVHCPHTHTHTAATHTKVGRTC